MTDLYYEFPQAAYLLFFVILFLILFWIFYQYRQNILARYASPEKWSELLVPQSVSNYWIKTLVFCLVWIGLCLALMQPKGNAHYPPQPATTRQQNLNILRLQPHEVIFLIDTSASMGVSDGRLGQTRLNNAKDIADQVMSRLKGQSGSLYAFTSEVTKLSPPSMDYLFMRLMLRNMIINEGDVSGTDLKAALKYIHDNYLNPSTSLIKTLIIISDGEDNHLEDLQGEEREKGIQDIVSLIGDPVAEKLHIYTVGVGTKKGGEIPKLTYEGKSVTSHLQDDLLQALSNKGQGRYYDGFEYAAVDIASDLASHIAKADVFATASSMSEKNASEDLIYDLYYQFPLGVALILLILWLFLPETALLNQEMFKRKLYPAAALVGIFLLLMGGRLFAAESPQDLLRLGEAYFEVQDYESAGSVYQALLHEELSGWKRSVVTYNLGTALSAEGQYEKALESFQSVPIDDNTSPVLITKLHRNLAVTNFRQAQQLAKAVQEKPPSSQDAYFKSIYFFKQALEEIALAQKTICSLVQVVGEESCSEDYDLKEIQSLSKAGIAQMRELARHHLVNYASLEQGLPWFSTGLQLLTQDINFLLDNDLSSSLESNYQQLFQEHALSWRPLWEALKAKLVKNEKYGTVDSIEANFNKMLTALSENEFKAAQTHLTVTSEALNQLMRLVFAADPLQETLSKILNDFSLAALQDPLEPNTVLFLLQKLDEITLPKAHDVLKVGIDAIKDNLEHSLGVVQRHQDLLGQMYFNEAWQQMKRILLLLDLQLQDQPDKILEAALSEQRHALTQTRLLSRLMEQQDKIPKMATSFVNNSQEYLLAFAEFFYNSAYSKERKEFTAEVPEGSPDLRCQYHPWNEVFPLFEEGIERVKKIVQILKASSKLNLVMQKQEGVLSVWEDALAKLRAPKNAESCHAQPLSNQPAKSFVDVSRLIEQMNYEDQKPSVPSVKLKEGLKPW